MVRGIVVYDLGVVDKFHGILKNDFIVILID